MSLIAFLVFGFIVGLIARAIMPGRQGFGILATMGLGVAGSFVGGLIGSLLFGGPIFELRTSGLIGSVLGSLLVLFLMGYSSRRRALG